MISVTKHSSPLASADISNHGNLLHRFSTAPRAQTMATVISSAARLRFPRPSRGARDLIARAASSSSNPGDGGESGDEGAYVVVFRGKEIRAKPGQRLRTALLLGGESPHNGGANAINCRGLGTCGTCAVEIVPSGAVTPRDWTDAERIRLNFPPHGPPGNARLRLSCQVRLGGDCEVVKRDKFWGQGDDVLGPRRDDETEGMTTPPLGALEFLLDGDEWREGGALGSLGLGSGRSDDGER